VWDLATGENKGSINNGLPIRALGVSPDNKFVVAGDANNEICVWRLNPPTSKAEPDEWGYSEATEIEPLVILKGHDTWILCVRLTPDGRRAVSSSADGAVMVWELASGQLIHSLAGHTGLVRRVAITPDGQMCLTVSEDETVRLWDLRNGSCDYVYRSERSVFGVSAVRANGQFICATTGESLRHLRLRGRKLGEPIVTATRLFRFAPYLERQVETSEYDQALLQRGEILLGDYDSAITARCAWCGELFNVSASTIDTIQGIAKESQLDPEWSECLNYPAEVWREELLRDQCPTCGGPLRFNPFIVDSRHKTG
jgi:hypothetical protein